MISCIYRVIVCYTEEMMPITLTAEPIVLTVSSNFFSSVSFHQNPIITAYSPSETIKIWFLDHSFVLRWRLNSRRTLLDNSTYCSVPQCWKRSSLRKTCINWIACTFVFVNKTILLIISSINGDFMGLLNQLHWIDNSINFSFQLPKRTDKTSIFYYSFLFI